MKLPALGGSWSRPPVIIAAAVVVVLILALVVAIAARRPRGVGAPSGTPSAERGDVLARLTERCYGPSAVRAEELEKTAPPLATDGSAFVRGLESLPFLAAIFAERDTWYEDANTKDPAALATEGKAAAIQFADLAIEVATCYERELAGDRSLRAAAGELLAELRTRRAELEALDFALFYTTGGPAEATLTLAPKEEKTVRLNTLCIDRFAQPPAAGMTYVLAGTVDALMKPELCDLLRRAASDENLARAQNAVWRLEQQRATPETPSVQPVSGSVGAYAAQSDRRLAVTATATGTLTTLDATFTNLSDQPLSIDTSCATFVPLIVPDVTKPLPTPPPDWSDPATLEKFQRESNEQLLKNLDTVEEQYRKLGVPFPPQLEEQRRQLRERLQGTPAPSPAGAVRGVYSQAFLPGGDVDPDQLDPFQPFQVGIGRQSLGSIGVTRRPPFRRERPPRPWEVVRRERGIEARELLERALDRYARNPADPGVVEDLMREVRRCEINLCMPPGELDRVWRNVAERVQRMVDVTLMRVTDSTTAETLQDVVNALRLCAAVGRGCTTDAAARRLDQHLRDYLRERQQRQRQQAG